MGLEDIYSTRLTLSLGSDDVLHHDYDHLHPRVYHQNKRSKPSPISDNYKPSLSLGLPWELKFEVVNDGSTEMMMNSQGSPAAAPSFSDSSLKREREISGGDEDELEAEKGSPRDEYQDEEVVGTRKKLRLTKEQSVVLEDSFKEHTTLNSKQKQELARRLNLRPRQVEVWFQNRRARTKLKQTEMDYEVLRKCYETLTDENRRLQKELQELKAANNQAAPPFHMAATLTMCPSCERTYGGSGDNSAKFSLAAGAKSQFYRSFLNPSAAC